MRQIPLSVRLPDRAVFASFLPARNAEALEHARRLASAEGSGLTWLAGPGGSGKTHLLQAICAAASEHMRAGFLPLAETARLGVDVLDGMPQLECLCLDDIDQVAGRAQWERAIFGLLRELEDSGGRLIVSAQAPPALMNWALRIWAPAAPPARCFSCGCSMRASSRRRCSCARGFAAS